MRPLQPNCPDRLQSSARCPLTLVHPRRSSGYYIPVGKFVFGAPFAPTTAPFYYDLAVDSNGHACGDIMDYQYGCTARSAARTLHSGFSLILRVTPSGPTSGQTVMWAAYLMTARESGTLSWFQMPSALPDETAPSASLGHLQAQAAPMHPGAPPEPLGSSPWPQELASGWPKDEEVPFATSRHDLQGFRTKVHSQRRSRAAEQMLLRRLRQAGVLGRSEAQLQAGPPPTTSLHLPSTSLNLS